jgi:hypothetical protein
MPYYLTLLLLIAPFLTNAQASQEPSTAPSPGQTEKTDNAANSVTLPDGLPIKLRLVNPLDSKTAKNEDEIQFAVVNDVVVGGRLILRRGAVASGFVTQAAASKTMGRAGRLSFTINAIKVANGANVQVRAFNKTNGENRTGEMVALMVEGPLIAAPFFLLIHGTNTTFPRGTEITAFVNGNLPLQFAADAANSH